MPVYDPNAARLGSSMPAPEKRTATPGQMAEASRSDHQHPRLTSAANATLDASGYATVMFTRTFDAEPVLVFGSIGSGTTPVPEFRGELIQSAGLYTGVRVFGQRSRAIPTINPISTGLASIFSLLGALNPILQQLSGFTPYEPASGARVSVTAIQAS
jgi:hypothetical protein